MSKWDRHTCRAHSEGHACHARRIAMDHPLLYNGPDKQVPPRGGRDKRVLPKANLEGHACHARRIAIRPSLIAPGSGGLPTHKTQTHRKQDECRHNLCPDVGSRFKLLGRDLFQPFQVFFSSLQCLLNSVD